MPTDASRAAQAAHLARLKAMDRYPGCTFTSPDNLAKHILSSAILDLLVKAQASSEPDGQRGGVNISGVVGSVGGHIVGGDFTQISFGLTPEQLRQLTEAAVRGATDAQQDACGQEVSKTLGLTESAAKNLLKIVGDDANVPEDKLAEALTKAAEDYKRLQTQLAALNPGNQSARARVDQAKSEIESGNFEQAHKLLREATQAQIAAAQEARLIRERAQAAEDTQWLGAASSTAAEGDVALTERKFDQAAQLFGQAAGYVSSDHKKERGDYLLRQADALYREGDERGDNNALREAIEVFGRALAQYPRAGSARLGEDADQSRPRALERSASGRAGRRGWRRRWRRIARRWRKRRASGFRSTGRRRRTISATRSRRSASGRAGRRGWRRRWRPIARRWRKTRERVPLDWATTQNNLGNALSRLGERESGTAQLEEAVAAYRAALEEKTRERVPLDWAATQNNLGNALSTLGERESGTARLEEAVAAYRAALEEWTRERVPLDWAGTQNNLGNALWTLGERESGTARLEEAVAAYRAALEE